MPVKGQANRKVSVDSVGGIAAHKRTSGSTSVVVERRSPQMAFETSLFKGGFREPSRRGGSALRAFILHTNGLRHARTACEGTRHSSLICNLRARVKNLGYVECCMPRDGSA